MFMGISWEGVVGCHTDIGRVEGDSSRPWLGETSSVVGVISELSCGIELSEPCLSTQD